jgi:two-component system sensor histidine kinase KdpD
MPVMRQDPDQLLRAIKNETSGHGRGHLKIFFGYAAGVGKTYAMLKAAHVAKSRGIDVVIGYIEPHARPQTTELTVGLERIPTRTVEYNGIVLSEFDIDAALKRKPSLILVDELAHTNAQGSRHTKRYQDVQELLKAGIDVYTTVNVQHIESLNDTVAAITGVLVRERIPDSVFDDADQVELVDIEPADLIDRLERGNVYSAQQADRAVVNFFTVDNLTALREIALRRCADRVNILTENAKIRNNEDYHTDEHILVCLSSAPSNPTIIRTASRMASAFRGAFTALFVETSDFSSMSDEDKKRLRTNIRLAQQLGATIETAYGDDVPYQIAEFARLSGVSKVVIGRSTASKRRVFGKPSLTDRLIALAPNLDIHIIPDSSAPARYVMSKAKRRRKNTFKMTLGDILKCIIILIATTVVGFAFSELGFSEANIVAVYILGVLVTSVLTTSKICSFVSSIVSVLVFNFFFTVPKFTFQAYDKEYPVTFLIMFMVALIAGSLASKLKRQARQAAYSAFRTKVLFDANQLIQKTHGTDEIVRATASQITKLLKRDVIMYLAEADGSLGKPRTFSCGEEPVKEEYYSESEMAVANWVLKNNKHAGASTDTLVSAKSLYLAIRVNERVYGVIGIVIEDTPLDAFENSVVLSILGECALAMENEKNAKEKEETAIIAKNEQLRANLLRAISHDLRTPLTSISGNASNLMSNGEQLDAETKNQIYSDIYDESMWLINLVENLLSVTRIEEGRVNMHFSTELMDEVVAEALRHVNRIKKDHNIEVVPPGEFLLAKIDAKLIVQVIINLVENAVKYTPPGSTITISTGRRENWVEVKVADNGPGISPEMKEHVFDMFYSGANKVADSRRSLGLGLSLCKSIVSAHGGEIHVSDNKPHGAVFTFTLPAGEVKLHE